MGKYILLLLSLFLFIVSPELYSQQNPPGIKWKFIDTGTYEIIFPEEITPLGQKVANLMVHYEKFNYTDIRTSPRRIPIVLIDQYAESNGFVSFAPFYSHWFTTPSSFTSIDWLKGLAIHEGRHMVQVNRLKDGPGKKTWRFLFGEAGTAAFAVLYVPAWYFEGDAVAMETLLTDGGRGRMPFFSLWYRALELSGRRYSYYKSYLGSYDALMPYADHYRLGYLLCSYITRHYGKDIWERVLDNTGSYFLFYTFDSSLQIETGRSIRELYMDAMNEYSVMWKKQLEGTRITEADVLLSGKGDHWESYLYPSRDQTGNLSAIKFSGDRKLSLVKQTANGEEVTIKQIPVSIASDFLYHEKNFTTAGDYALWHETIPDPRWGYKSFSDLRLLDMKNGNSHYITRNGKFIAAALSTDGKTAIGIEYTGMKYYLTAIDTATKSVTLHEEIPATDHVFDPAVSPDGKIISLAAFSDKGNAILLYDMEKKKFTPITGYTNRERFRAPVFYGRYILYGSDYSGIDNIYAVDLSSRKRFQVTSRPMGAYFPSVSGNTLCFNDYTVSGYQAVSMEIDTAEWIPLEKVKNRTVDYQDLTAKALPGDKTEINLVPETEYEVKDYRPILHMINIYGWIPFFSFTPTDFYFSVLSRDVLQTTDIIGSYVHNFNEHSDAGEVSLVYSGFYPVFTLKGRYGDRVTYLSDESEKEDKKIFLTWNEAIVSGGISFPLNFSRGIHTVSLNFGADSGYIKIQDKNRDDYTVYDGLGNGELRFARYFLSYSHLTQPAMHSVMPGTGGQIDISYAHTPCQGDYTGSLFSGEISFFLPGFTDMQGLKLAASYEHLEYDNYIFPEKVLFPRGYDELRYENFYKGSADYMFPMFNVSFNIWKLAYFRRINGDIFFDCGAGKNGGEPVYYRSSGFELTSEMNILSNIYLAIEAGVRYSYCIDTGDNKYEFVVKAPM